MSLGIDEDRAQTAGSAAATHLVDTDVHEMITSINDLMPYLAPVWQRWLGEYAGPFFNTNMVGNGWPYTVPGPGVRVEWLEPGAPPPGSDLELLRKHLFEGEGVTIAILDGLCHFSALKGNYEFAAALAAAYNDWVIENWLEQEPRLRGSVHVVAHDPHVAAREIDRVGDHPQIVQVFLPTVTDRQYGDPHYWPIFEAALRHDLPVAFHHANHTQTVLGYPRTYTEWHTVAAPQAAQNQLLSLICNGLFDKFPELKVVFLEASVGWLPWFMARLDQQYRESRSEIPWVKRLPSEHMRTSVRLATQPLSDLKPGEFQRLIAETGSERMFMFSTDYPHYDADSAASVLPKSMATEIRQRIRYLNAAETYPKLGLRD
jgi:predicted TIM-barrel fold metal-dependent hydrolase